MVEFLLLVMGLFQLLGIALLVFALLVWINASAGPSDVAERDSRVDFSWPEHDDVHGSW